MYIHDGNLIKSLYAKGTLESLRDGQEIYAGSINYNDLFLKQKSMCFTSAK
jgi:hypothetical protein